MKAAAENVVEVRDLHFAYNANAVFRGLSLTVPRGKLVAILGTSGCGKSTLLKLIGGQLRPSRGAVRVNGEVVHELSTDALYAMRRKMGMMFQKSGLFTDLSTFENIAFPMRERTTLPDPVIRDLVLMKLHAVGLRGAHRLMPNELSGGMQRRVALARAIALDPMLIMYDEPFTGLDPIAMGVISNLVRRLNDALGATSIIVTHDVQESLKIVDYVYFMSDGVVAAEGTADEIRKSNAPFVHQFVWGEIDGPMPFHYPGDAYASDLGLGAARG